MRFSSSFCYFVLSDSSSSCNSGGCGNRLSVYPVQSGVKKKSSPECIAQEGMSLQTGSRTGEKQRGQGTVSALMTTVTSLARWLSAAIAFYTLFALASDYPQLTLTLYNLVSAVRQVSIELVCSQSKRNQLAYQVITATVCKIYNYIQ